MNTLSPITSNPKRADNTLARDILAQIPEYVKDQYKLRLWEHYPNTIHFSHGRSSGTIPVTEDTSLSIDYDIKNPDEVFCLCIHTINRYFISLTPSLDLMSISMWLR